MGLRADVTTIEAIDDNNSISQLSLFDQNPYTEIAQFKMALGLPIGNLTSQFFANLYLNELDQYAKHTLNCHHYIRYMDDLVLFDNDKTKLMMFAEYLGDFVKERLKIKFHEGVCAVPVSRGLTFLGFRLFHNHWRLKSGSVNRFVKRMKAYQKACAQGNMPVEKLTQSVRSWIAHAAYAQTWMLRRQLLSGFVFHFGERNF